MFVNLSIISVVCTILYKKYLSFVITSINCFWRWIIQYKLITTGLKNNTKQCINNCYNNIINSSPLRWEIIQHESSIRHDPLLYQKLSTNQYPVIGNQITNHEKVHATGWPFAIGKRLCIARNWQKYLITVLRPDASTVGLTAADRSPSSWCISLL